MVTNYTDPSFNFPSGITAGPDGALWFTNDNSIERITTDGVVSNYTDPSIDSRVASPQGRTVPCGSPTRANNSIGTSPGRRA